jgi:hypothetical protein
LAAEVQYYYQGDTDLNKYRLNFSVTALLCVAASLPARAATIIDFEAQATAANAPNHFTGIQDSPLVITGVTFTGGQLLKGETGEPDTTGVYATANFLTGYSDPLLISFSTPVSGFSILVTDVLPDTYTVSDDRGGSSSLAIGSGQQVFSLSDSGITTVDISSASTAIWDFAIDNVTYTPLAATVPEPASILLVVPFLGGMVFLSRRKAGWNRQ